MAATGFTPIRIYASTTASAVPLAANLDNTDGAELAINVEDEKLYFKNASGAVKLLASNASSAGTVSSVAVSVPAFLSVAGSPITTSGTIALSYSGSALPVANGGTGATSLTANNVILGNGTSAVQVVAPGTAGNVLTSNGTTWASAAAAASLLGVTDSASPFETSLGYEAGLNTTGVRNTFVGYRAGKANIGGADNAAIGYAALSSNTTGDANTAFGSNAATACTTGSRNTVFGASAQSGTTGSFNSVFGWGAMNQASTAYENSTFGYNAFNQATTGYRNVSFGYGAMGFADTGNNNVAVGHSAAAGISSGAQNTVIGSLAGYTGTNNLSSGSNNIIIGYNAAPTASTVNNEATLGNSSIATLRCQVTTITSLSDARDKTNIADLSAGLNLINAVRPVSFDWNMRDGGKVGVQDTGFIAQELKAAQEVAGVNIPGLVYENNPDQMEAGYGKLLPVMVKAIQELSAKVDSLQAELTALKGN